MDIMRLTMVTNRMTKVRKAGIIAAIINIAIIITNMTSNIIRITILIVAHIPVPVIPWVPVMR
jgi:hypothetical protein